MVQLTTEQGVFQGRIQLDLVVGGGGGGGGTALPALVPSWVSHVRWVGSLVFEL